MTQEAADRAEAIVLSLPTLATLATAHDEFPPENRELVIVRLIDGDQVGWGECSALNRPTYNEQFARGCYDSLTDHGMPIGSMAKAAVTMAMWDARLKRRGESLKDAIAADPSGAPMQDRVRAGVALGMAPLDRLEAQAHELADAGYRRIKLKINEAVNLDAVRAVQQAAPNVEIHVDANAGLTADHLGMLGEIEALGVTAIEQPFAVDDLDSARELVRRSSIPIVADEAIGGVDDVKRLFAAGALSAVSLKGARLGGISEVVSLVDWCAEHGLAATAGGMLEGGLGRHALATLAALPGFTITGDVSPAGRWLADDPWPDLTLVDGEIVVPTGPGVAPDPDEDVLDRYTVARADIRMGLFDF